MSRLTLFRRSEACSGISQLFGATGSHPCQQPLDEPLETADKLVRGRADGEREDGGAQQSADDGDGHLLMEGRPFLNGKRGRRYADSHRQGRHPDRPGSLTAT